MLQRGRGSAAIDVGCGVLGILDLLCARMGSSGRVVGVDRALRDAGLAEVQVRVTARATHDGEYYQTFLLTLTSLVRDQIITGGRLTAADFDAQAASLREHLERRGTLTCQPTLWQAWGTKPETR